MTVLRRTISLDVFVCSWGVANTIHVLTHRNDLIIRHKDQGAKRLLKTQILTWSSAVAALRTRVSEASRGQ